MNNVEIIKFEMKCSSEEAFQYLNDKGLVNRDCMGNVKPLISKILFPEEYVVDFKRFQRDLKKKCL